MIIKELIEELNERLEDIEQAKTKPGHGVCCTCQECGHCHDDCTCYDEKVARETIEKLQECYRWENLKNNSQFQEVYCQYMKEVLRGDADWRSTIEKRLDKLERPGK